MCFGKSGWTMKKWMVKVSNYYKEHGAAGVIWRVIEKTTGCRPGAVSYEKWLPLHLPSEQELKKQRHTRFKSEPLFSIVIPLFHTNRDHLEACIHSIQNQTYRKWELCLSDGSGVDSPLKEMLARYAALDGRIRVIDKHLQMGISENTNTALEIARGDFIVFADHDDCLAPHALYECARYINEEPMTELLYSDEDKLSMDGRKHFDPSLKPDFNLDLLRSMNYICHLLVIKSSLLRRAGMLRSAYDGAQDYDLILRCVEATEDIGHIPKILYHWRCHQASTAENPESKSYAFDAGMRAVQDHYRRQGIPAQAFQGEHLGLYRTIYFVEGRPLISILIPNKDHVGDLQRCLGAIMEKSTYQNVEYIIIENNSTEQATFDYYDTLQKENARVKVIYYEGGFNYSAINNFGVRHAAGEYLLFLNNDTEMIDEDCLEELLGICSRKDVGAVGARLYYADDTIQHAGVIIGMGGIAGHAFAGERRSAAGYGRRIICNQNLSAVTAACMLVKKIDFDAVGGFDENFRVAFNDVDFCLKLGEAGKRIVYAPYAQLYHFESKSRGAEDTKEKVARFHQEIDRFRHKWGALLKKGDPCYNPNLSLERPNFTLKRLERKESISND